MKTSRTLSLFLAANNAQDCSLLCFSSVRFVLFFPSQIQFLDKLRCVLLYSLRYESLGHLPVLKNIARAHAALANYDEHVVDNCIDTMLRLGGPNNGPSRSWPLFPAHLAGDSISLKSLAKSIQTGVGVGGGIENIFTQHKPVLHEILIKLFEQELRTSNFPFVEGVAGMPAAIGDVSGGVGSGGIGASAASSLAGGGAGAGPRLPVHRKIIVYIVGGVTFEEHAATEALLASPRFKGNFTVLLGGSCVHNSASFLRDTVQVDAFRIQSRTSVPAPAAMTSYGDDQQGSYNQQGQDDPFAGMRQQVQQQQRQQYQQPPQQGQYQPQQQQQYQQRPPQQQQNYPPRQQQPSQQQSQQRRSMPPPQQQQGQGQQQQRPRMSAGPQQYQQQQPPQQLQPPSQQSQQQQPRSVSPSSQPQFLLMGDAKQKQYIPQPEYAPSPRSASSSSSSSSQQQQQQRGGNPPRQQQQGGPRRQ
jgi:hypothetical protein